MSHAKKHSIGTTNSQRQQTDHENWFTQLSLPRGGEGQGGQETMRQWREANTGGGCGAGKLYT